MDRGIAGIVGRITGPILPRETLLAGPRVEEGPSTVKCSSESNRRPRACPTTSSKNARAMSPSSKRSRFLVNVVGVHTASSMPRPTNHRNNTLYWSCSISRRSLRTE